jgi:hypothetical protein
MTRAMAIALLIATAAAGCSSGGGSDAGRTDTRGNDGGGGGDAPAGDVPGGDAGCSLPLDQIGCAATFDEEVQQDPFCAQPGICSSVGGTCGIYRVFFVSFGLGSLLCVYDGTGHQLLSGTTCTDISQYCGNTQYCISGGRTIDLASSCDVSALPRLGPDAGTD